MVNLQNFDVRKLLEKLTTLQAQEYQNKQPWIQNGSARVGLKSRPGVDFISTGSADQNRTDAQCLTNT